MDKLKYIKLEQPDGSYSESIPLSAEAQYITLTDGDSIEDKINKKVYYYNNIENMKIDTKLKVGDMAITLGYHNLNDGGGAEYRIVNGNYVSNNGSYHKLNNNLYAELIIEDKINVKQFGAYGDGIHDDALAIQTAINFGKNKTIYFPDNCVFLVSSHIYTSAQHDEKQFLQLAPNTTIKADSSFTDEYVIRLGETGTMEGYSASNYITGLDGGTIDGNTVAGGICSERTHLARITNTNVVKAKDVGIKIARANNSSSDAWLENIYVHGCDKTNINAIGLWVDGYDNNILMVRTSNFPIGVKLTGGGNFLKNCHPLYGVGAAGLSYYEDSVAFWIAAQDNMFEQCYNDNFSTGWLQDGEYNWSSKQMFNYWYEGFDYRHSWIRIKNAHYFRGRVDGLMGDFNSTVGKNRILISDYGASGAETYNLGPKPDTKGLLSNLNINDPKKLRNVWTEEAFGNNVLNINHYTMLNANEHIDLDTWYPFLFVRQGSSVPLTVDLSIGTRFQMELQMIIDSDELSKNAIVRADIKNNGYNFNKLTFGKQSIIFDEEFSNPLVVWYFKISEPFPNEFPASGGMGGYGVSITGGNILYSKLIIPWRHLPDYPVIVEKIAETPEHPIEDAYVMDNTMVLFNKGTSRGNHLWKKVNTIKFDSGNSFYIVQIHFSQYNFIYWLKNYNNKFWKKEILEDPTSVGHEPTIEYDSTTKVVTITTSETATIDYFHM